MKTVLHAGLAGVLWIVVGTACEPYGHGPYVTGEACEDAGGHIVYNTGGPDAYREGCPWGSQFLGTLSSGGGLEGGICCSGAASAAARPAMASLDPSQADGGASCTQDSDCPAGKVCDGCTGTPFGCVMGCHSDDQCEGGAACQEVRCVRCPCPGLCDYGGCGF